FIDRKGVAVADQNSTILGLLLVFTDATEERQLVQAREDLTRMIVHDLRSPLTAINASMKLLSEIATSDDAVGRSIHTTVDISQRALRKLLNLVNSLLDIAKMESGTITLDIKDSNFLALAENVRVELSPLAEELNIEVRIDLPDAMPLLAVDHDKIERVLLNLVDNALKYAPMDGVIYVRARQHPEDGENLIRIEVIDNGPGIPDEFKARIFDRFQQIDGSKSHRRGTGLGLTFCRLTVEAHGGKIWIEDNPEGGSIFAFTLPVAVEREGELDG
ncbi:MAG: histidine kinase, partial [Anaerolineae bacterium]|nr:histidine kinase [Anaerolineae bacterium]